MHWFMGSTRERVLQNTRQHHSIEDPFTDLSAKTIDIEIEAYKQEKHDD